MDETAALTSFGNLVPECREALWSESIIHNLPRGQVLCREGDECLYLPLVVFGSLRVFKAAENGREVTLYTVESGSSCILSAAGILRGTRFPAIAVTESDTQVLLVPVETVKRLYDQFPGWRDFILSLYTDRVSAVIQLIEDVLFRRLDDRLWEYIATKSESRVLKKTHQRIAEELGSTREVISRLLKDLENQGKIIQNRGAIELTINT